MPDLAYHHDEKQATTGKYGRVLRRLEEHSRILEVGCHTGFFTSALLKEGHTVIGIDIDGDAVAFAQNADLPVIQENIENISGLISKVGSDFDVILLMDVLEHLVNPEKTLLNIKSLLNPSGRLIIVAPNIGYWAARKDLALGKWQYRDGGIFDRTHLHFYNRKGWLKLFEGAGYAVSHFGVADSMIPWEQHWLKVPGLKAILPAIKATCEKSWPDFFAISFLFEVAPKK